MNPVRSTFHTVCYINATATLVFTGDDDVFVSSSFAGPGETRSLGGATLNGVEIAQAASFVNTGALAQAGEVSDAGLIRNVGTWTLGADDEIAATASGAQFVNVGTFDANAGGVDVISTDFVDYGRLDYSGILEFSGADSLINTQGLPIGDTGAGSGAIAVIASNMRFLNATAPSGNGFRGVISKLTASGDGARLAFLYNASLKMGAFAVNDLTLAANAAMVIAANATVGLGDPAGPAIAGVVRGAGELTSMGAVALLNGARLIVSADLDEVDVSGRVFVGAPNQAFTVDNVALNNGRLVLAGGTVGGDISGEISGEGQVVNQGTLNLFSLDPSGAISDDAAVVNYGQAYLGGYGAEADIALASGATLLNQAGANMYFETEGVFDLTGGEIVNDGSLAMRSMAAPPSVPGYGTAVISAAVENNGDIASGAGIEFENAVTGTGYDTITAVDLKGSALVSVQGEGLTFDAGVGAGQTIVFTDAGQRLTLNDLAGFQGAVSGFDAIGDDAIVVGSAWSLLGFTENAAGTGGALEFSGNGVETGVSLTGSFASSGFQAATSGDKTTITYTAP